MYSCSIQRISYIFAPSMTKDFLVGDTSTTRLQYLPRFPVETIGDGLGTIRVGKRTRLGQSSGWGLVGTRWCQGAEPREQYVWRANARLKFNLARPRAVYKKLEEERKLACVSRSKRRQNIDVTCHTWWSSDSSPLQILPGYVRTPNIVACDTLDILETS